MTDESDHEARIKVAAELGAEIRVARESAGLSTRRAADLAGISEGRWRQYELGYEKKREARLPVVHTTRLLRSMARVLEVDPTTWLEKAGLDVRSPEPVARGRADGDVLPLDGLDEPTKSYLRTIAEEARRRNPDAQ